MDNGFALIVLLHKKKSMYLRFPRYFDSNPWKIGLKKKKKNVFVYSNQNAFVILRYQNVDYKKGNLMVFFFNKSSKLSPFLRDYLEEYPAEPQHVKSISYYSLEVLHQSTFHPKYSMLYGN